MYVLSPYILSTWVFPHHKLPFSHKCTHIFFGVALFVVYLMPGSYLTWLLHPIWFFAIHVMYRNEVVNPDSPSTYMKYAMPVAYFFLTVKIVSDWMELGFGGMIFAFTFLYLMTTGSLLIAFDRPLQKPKITPSETSSSTSNPPSTIINSGYYFSTIFYATTVIGTTFGLLLVTLRTSPTLIITIVLQAVSLLLLEVAVVYSKRSTDGKR